MDSTHHSFWTATNQNAISPTKSNECLFLFSLIKKYLNSNSNYKSYNSWDFFNWKSVWLLIFPPRCKRINSLNFNVTHCLVGTSLESHTHVRSCLRSFFPFYIRKSTISNIASIENLIDSITLVIFNNAQLKEKIYRNTKNKRKPKIDINTT